MRPIAWRGSEQMGVSAQHTKIHVAIASWEWPSYFKPEQRAKGIRLTCAKYRRPVAGDRADRRPRRPASI